MKTSYKGLFLIKESEGFSKKAYLCPARVWTIGYGNTWSDVKLGLIITREEAEKRLKKDLEKIEIALNNNINVPINQNQFDALISFIYNIGIYGFLKSTLLKFLNQKKYLEAANEFLRWDKVKRKTIKGLTIRRKKEQFLFLTGSLEKTILRYADKVISHGNTLQEFLNKFIKGEPLKVDGWPGEKTSNVFKELTGYYLAGDPRIEKF